MKNHSTIAEMPSTAQADVRAAQEKLRDKGYDLGPVDGIWGPRTAAAVSQYQRKEKMTVTNRLDPETLRKLEVATRKPQSP
jgi:peptidoglycan hydrolase-like protein with peptidoglycan-binding domain